MFQESDQGADAFKFPPIVPPVNPPTDGTLPEYQYETVNHTLFGTLIGIQHTIKLLHKLHYADPNDWSKPLPTGRPNEMMAILTKRIRIG